MSERHNDSRLPVWRRIALATSGASLLLVAACNPTEGNGEASHAHAAAPRAPSHAKATPQPPENIPAADQPKCHQKIDLKKGWGKVNVTDPEGTLAQVAVSPHKALAAILFAPYTKKTGPPTNIYKLTNIEPPNWIAFDRSTTYKLDDTYHLNVNVIGVNDVPSQLITDCLKTPAETTLFGQALK